MNGVNNDYKIFVSKVFSFFGGNKVGQGLFLLWTLMGKLNILKKIIN